MFIGLLGYADRNGILLHKAKFLKSRILPYDEKIDGEKLINELIDHPKSFLIAFEVDGVKYLKIKNFLKHQNPHPHEKSGFPKNVIACNDNIITSSDTDIACNGSSGSSKPYNLELRTSNLEKIKTHSPDSLKPESERVVKIINKFSPEDMRFVEKMRTDISKFDPKRKFRGSIESWAKDICKLREIDKRSPEEMKAMWLLVQSDNFWHKQILSASKFREKYSDLKTRLDTNTRGSPQVNKLTTFEKKRNVMKDFMSDDTSLGGQQNALIERTV